MEACHPQSSHLHKGRAPTSPCPLCVYRECSDDVNQVWLILSPSWMSGPLEMPDGYFWSVFVVEGDSFLYEENQHLGPRRTVQLF